MESEADRLREAARRFNAAWSPMTAVSIAEGVAAISRARRLFQLSRAPAPNEKAPVAVAGAGARVGSSQGE